MKDIEGNTKLSITQLQPLMKAAEKLELYSELHQHLKRQY